MLKSIRDPRSIAGLAAGIGLLSTAIVLALPEHTTTQTYIVQGASLAVAKQAVEAAGGEITHELGVISAVAATLTADQHEALRTSASVRRIYGNRRIETAKKQPAGVTDVTGVNAITRLPQLDPLSACFRGVRAL